MLFPLNPNNGKRSQTYPHYHQRLRQSIHFLWIAIIFFCDFIGDGVGVNSSFLITKHLTNDTLFPINVSTPFNTTTIIKNPLPTLSSSSLQNQSVPNPNPMSFAKITPNNTDPIIFLHQQVFNPNNTNSPDYTGGLLPGVGRKVIKNQSRILNTKTTQNFTSHAGRMPMKNQSVISARQNYVKFGGRRNVRNVRTKGKLGHNDGVSKTLLSSDGRKVLTILGLFEFSYNDTVAREVGESERLAAQMALDDINGNDNILRGYKLVLITNDTQCDPGAGVDAFFHALYSRKNISTKIISLLGTACSEVTERVAKVATHQRIVQVSFGSLSPSLSDRKEFPLFFRTVAPVSSHAQAIIELITHFNWDTVSFFTENENQYSMPMNHLVKEMEEKGNITCKETLTFSLSDLQDQLNVLNESDSRIIIASFGIDVAPRVFCEVYKRKMYGPDYAWLWIGKPETIWWTDDTTFTSNTPNFHHLSNSSISRSRRTGSPNRNSTHIGKYTEGYHKSEINNDFNYHSSSLEVDESRLRTNSYQLGYLRMQKGKSDQGGTKHQKQFSVTELGCSRKELTLAIENTLIVDRFNLLEGDRLSDFGLSTESFGRRLKERIQMEKSAKRSSPNTVQGDRSQPQPIFINKSSMNNNHTSLSQFAPETYDAVWTIALGLQKLQEKYNYSLENFKYMDDYFSHLLNQEISGLKFTGISGPITFSGSDRVGITSFMQVQEGNLYQVGLFTPNRKEGKLELAKCSDIENTSTNILTKPRRPPRCRSIKWPGNQVPISRREFRTKLIRVENSLYIFVAAVAFLGILLAATFLAFNLYYRKLKYIKLSSPRLNNMVIVGCMFAYVAVIILGSDFGRPSESNEIRFSYICTMRAYLLSMAFSLAFGAMFAKTYRVHRIFTRSCIGVVKNKLLKDTQLMTLVMALLLIDVIIVTSWAVVDPMHRHLQNLTLQNDVSDRSVVYQPQIEVCRSQHGHVWLSAMYAYKSLLLVVGIYITWETRHVKIHALNDSRNIAYCVYIVVLTSVLAVSLANLVSERVTLSFASVSALILTSTTATLCLLFLPKIHAIKTGGHKGDPVVESMGLKIEFNTRRLVVEDAKELLFRAEVQNRVYKRQIEAIDVEIWRLENLLLHSSNSPSLASLDNAKKSSKETRGSHPSKESATSGGDNDAGDADGVDTSSSDSSEIYTVYLHGPRFIVPISVLNFQNPNATLEPLSSNISWTGNNKPSPKERSSSTLHPPPPPPRSSWPNVRSLLTPSGNGLITKIRFKSEPKLVIEEPTTTTFISTANNALLMDSGGNLGNNPELLLSPRVTFGSDDSFGGGDSISRSNISKGKGSRKSSSTSVGGGGSNKRSTGFLALLKQPFTYFSGMVRSGACSTSPTLLSKNQHKIGDNYRAGVGGGSDYEDEPQVFHLRVPNDSVRKKFNSVPDLWAVRSSPILQHCPPKNPVLSDSIMDTSSLRFVSEVDNPTRNKLSCSNPVLKLTATSDVSPYL